MKKFLIVEDDQSMRSLYSVLLTRYYKKSTINFCYNGNEALNEALNTDYDLIISDINMERMDGITFYQKLKELDPLLADRIIFMSSSTSGPHIHYIKNEGLTFLAKPFKISDFYATLASNHYLHHDRLKSPQDSLGARKLERINLNDNCIIETFFDNNFLTKCKIKAQSIDYSPGGMGIKYSGKKLTRGEYVHVYMEAKDISERGARVVWSSGMNENTYRMGLKWV